ncbi:hypothetical protein [Prauserella cavernicola]|uniref:Uncharacterized protein n=1 Tax=Prauserella cavernicola TaxID=2800127 RepID=A0A934V1Z4_9PSEU|nr:hypothetical protein [Prauserella cavernicola]MBK1784271.1 hypothetical protein [Prauserella cavernicola]
MARGAIGLPARWALLCALALAVVAMHHVGASPTSPAGQATFASPGAPQVSVAVPMHADHAQTERLATGVKDQTARGNHANQGTHATQGKQVGHANQRDQGNHDGHSGHEMLHLCLAVLAVIGGLLLAAWFRGLAVHTVPALRGAVAERSTARAPPRRGRDHLHLACVLRV